MHHDANLRFASERLRLRPLAPGDARLLARVLGDPRVVFWRVKPLRLAAMQGHIARSRRLNRRGLGMWLVFEAASGELVGDALLAPLRGTNEIELGYHIRPEFQGRGYATEAGRHLLRHAFETLGLARIGAVALPRNRPSLRVLEKLGFGQRGSRLHAGLPHRYFRLDPCDNLIGRQPTT